jgi:hypothetical protein
MDPVPSSPREVEVGNQSRRRSRAGDHTTVERGAPARWLVGVGAAMALALAWFVLVVGTGDDTSTSAPPTVPGSPAPIETGPTTTSVPEPEPRFGSDSMMPVRFPVDDEAGDVVAAVTWHTEDETWKRGAMYVYADGRVISTRGVDEIARSPEWTERRLTTDGVELVRSEILGSGLFEPGREEPSPLGAFAGTIVVRDGDRLLHPYWEGDTPTFSEVVGHVRDLGDWLPDDAWEERELKGWGPARYGMCLSEETGSVDRPLRDPDAVMVALGQVALGPVPEHARHWQPAGVLEAEPGPDCYEVTMVAASGWARTYDAAVDWGDFVRVGEDGYEWEAPPPVSAMIHVAFIPLLPDGELAIVEPPEPEVPGRPG